MASETTIDFGLRRGDSRTASQWLAETVRGLARARSRQVLVARAWAGLFLGLLAAAAGILAARLDLHDAPWETVVGVSLGLGVLGAALVARWQRPGPLEVAILADLRLGTKEQLSTAWQFAEDGADPVVAGALAEQAVRARGRVYPERVFPFGINTWARLTPIAAALLLLVSLVDLSQVSRPAPAPAADRATVEEGARLREYGRRMESRASRESFPRSLTASRQMQRIGERMASAELTRGEALSRLRDLGEVLDEERRAALDEGTQLDAGPLGMNEMSGLPMAQSQALRAQIMALLDGESGGSPGEGLAADPSALSRLGLTQEELREAMERFASGDESALRDLLDRLDGMERALGDASELDGARRAVDRARENLGDAGSDGQPSDDSTRSGAVDETDGAAAGKHAPSEAEMAGEADGMEDGTDGAYSPQGSGQQRTAAPERERQRRGTFIKPESQLREGPVYRSSVRVLPRFDEPEVEAAQLDVRFEAQLEEVLSKEEYPLHYKEFLRRYFLGLSQGVPQATQGETR